MLLTTAAVRHCWQAEAAAKTQTKAKVAFDDLAVPETAALLVKESCCPFILEDSNYRISANSCRDNYSFFEAWVRQLFKGDNYSKEETINFLVF